MAVNFYTHPKISIVKKVPEKQVHQLDVLSETR